MDKTVSPPTESGLPAGTDANPGRVSERTRWVGVTLARGTSLDGRADRLDDRLILGLETSVIARAARPSRSRSRRQDKSHLPSIGSVANHPPKIIFAKYYNLG